MRNQQRTRITLNARPTDMSAYAEITFSESTFLGWIRTGREYMPIPTNAAEIEQMKDLPIVFVPLRSEEMNMRETIYNSLPARSSFYTMFNSAYNMLPSFASIRESVYNSLPSRPLFLRF